MIAAWAPSLARAQGADGRLIVTVVDTSGAVVPGAKVTVSSLDDGARAATFAPVTTTDKGVATVEGLLPGRYRVQAEFPGFEIGILPEVRVRARRQQARARAAAEEDGGIGHRRRRTRRPPRPIRAATPSRPCSRAQEIENLSDDPQPRWRSSCRISPAATPTIRVDSFAGAPLPPKALIKSIHIVARRLRGGEPLRGVRRDRHHHAARAGRAERRRQLPPARRFAERAGVRSSPRKVPSARQNFEGNIGGTLIKGKSSFALSFDGRNAFDTPIIYVALPNGEAALGARCRCGTRPRTGRCMACVDYALTRDQTLRLSATIRAATRRRISASAAPT